jgi:predicted lipid-binding transport protein (Tim44 family)
MGGTVPLSEHEQRQLEQIEQALYNDYPRFANAVRASDPRVHYRRRVIAAALGFLLGVGMLLAGVVTKYIWIGVAGFVVMLACAMWALTSYRHMTGVSSSQGAAKAKAKQAGKRRGRRQPSSGMMERFEERWRRRQERDR